MEQCQEKRDAAALAAFIKAQGCDCIFIKTRDGYVVLWSARHGRRAA